MRFWIALAAIAIAAVALLDVRTTDPRVTVRWGEEITAADREALERRYQLRNGEDTGRTTWRYELADRSRENIGALIQDPAVEDTGYIDRDALTADRARLSIGIRPLPFPFGADEGLSDARRLFQVQTLFLLLAGGIVLSAARAAHERLRRNVTLATLLAVGMLAVMFPISPTFVHMGDANQQARSREDFEKYAAVTFIRYEGHLTYVILDQLDRLLDRAEDAPQRVQTVMTRVTTAWFVAGAIGIGVLEHWSPLVLRYVGLALLAPCALMYFGWREFGYFSLNVAAFPLLARGLRDGGWRLEAGSTVAGLGTALHGFGLVSLTGAWIAALATRARLADRVDRLLRIAAWGTAAYLGWVAVYEIVMKLPIVTGHAGYFPWRHWFASEILEGRLNVPIFSLIGARDLLFTVWVVGAPLLIVAASLWRRHGDEVRTALAYAVPSVIFTTLIWPAQGLGEDMDLVFAWFPAIYAMSWVCAHEPKRTLIAAALLVSGHLAFWRILLDSRFINPAIY